MIRGFYYQDGTSVSEDEKSNGLINSQEQNNDSNEVIGNSNDPIYKNYLDFLNDTRLSSNAVIDATKIE